MSLVLIGTRPMVGLMPYTPQKLAGRRIEPPASPPNAHGPTPLATAAAAPADEPPEVRCGFHGLPVGSPNGVCPVPENPNSATCVLPITTAPAALSRSTAISSTSGTNSA